MATPLRRDTAAFDLLTLLPVLVGATSTGTGLALGIATAVVALITTVAGTLIGPAAPFMRVLLGTVVAGALATCFDLLSHALLPELHTALGPFVLLMAPTAALYASLRADVAMHSRAMAATHTLLIVAAFTAVGALRELIGQGTLLADVALLAGLDASTWRIRSPWRGMLAATLLPGAFIAAAALLVWRNRRSVESPD